MLTIVFDLDGTLVDTAPDLVDTLNVVLVKEGLPAVPFERGRLMIGGGARGMIERALVNEGRICATAEVDQMYATFIAHYTDHIADRSRPYPGLEATLKQLAHDGQRLAVCTNKLERLSVKLLQTLRLAQYFASICGQDTFPVRKPDPDMLRLTVRRAGGNPADAVMVGDSSTDVYTARGAGVPAIAVDFGYSDVPVATLQPDRVISSLADLPAAIAGLSEQASRQRQIAQSLDHET